MNDKHLNNTIDFLERFVGLKLQHSQYLAIDRYIKERERDTGTITVTEIT